MKTTITKDSTIERKWHLLDANDAVLGRFSTQVAQLLIGKGKTYFTPNLDCGDYVVVINAKNIRVTGNKTNDKMYYRHSGYPGALKEINFQDKLAKDPVKVIELAVKGMLPKNKLRQPRVKRLKVFSGDSHPYADKLSVKSEEANKD